MLSLGVTENSFSTAIQTGEELWQHPLESLRLCTISEAAGRPRSSLQISMEANGTVSKRQIALPSVAAGGCAGKGRAVTET